MLNGTYGGILRKFTIYTSYFRYIHALHIDTQSFQYIQDNIRHEVDFIDIAR